MSDNIRDEREIINRIKRNVKRNPKLIHDIQRDNLDRWLKKDNEESYFSKDSCSENAFGIKIMEEVKYSNNIKLILSVGIIPEDLTFGDQIRYAVVCYDDASNRGLISAEFFKTFIEGLKKFEIACKKIEEEYLYVGSK